MKNNSDKARMHSEEELQEMMVKMQAISNEFYPQATRTGNHAFIEFCGLMNEYIKMCQTTVNRGMDFTVCNTHLGVSLQAEDFQIQYLAEKFDCIFGPMLSVPENKAIFFKAMGWPCSTP